MRLRRRPRSRPGSWLARAAAFALLVVLAGAPELGAQGGDRSTILLRLDCGSQISRQELTLFANGTVRLRERLQEQTQLDPSDLGQARDRDSGALHMYLGELPPEDLAGYLARFEQENLSESEESAEDSLGGPWVERCRLEVDLPGKPARDLTFSRYDSLSLGTAQVVRIARELLDRVDRGPGLEAAFPPDYLPAPGDVLERLDGHLFEVVRYTDDGGGVELEGVEQPVTLYIDRVNLTAEFRRLVRREE